MSNSIIIKSIFKLSDIFKNAYINSSIRNIFCKIDNFFANASLNSNVTKLIIGNDNKKTMQNSKIYLLITNIFLLLNKIFKKIDKYISNSQLVRLANITIKSIIDNPFKVISIFGIGFLVSNITIGLIIGHVGLISISIKLFMLIVFIFISVINIPTKEMFQNSLFIRFFKWIISY